MNLDTSAELKEPVLLPATRKDWRKELLSASKGARDQSRGTEGRVAGAKKGTPAGGGERGDLKAGEREEEEPGVSSGAPVAEAGPEPAAAKASADVPEHDEESLWSMSARELCKRAPSTPAPKPKGYPFKERNKSAEPKAAKVARREPPRNRLQEQQRKRRSRPLLSLKPRLTGVTTKFPDYQEEEVDRLKGMEELKQK